MGHPSAQSALKCLECLKAPKSAHSAQKCPKVPRDSRGDFGGELYLSQFSFQKVHFLKLTRLKISLACCHNARDYYFIIVGGGRVTTQCDGTRDEAFLLGTGKQERKCSTTFWNIQVVHCFDKFMKRGERGCQPLSLSWKTEYTSTFWIHWKMVRGRVCKLFCNQLRWQPSS